MQIYWHLHVVGEALTCLLEGGELLFACEKLLQLFGVEGTERVGCELEGFERLLF